MSAKTHIDRFFLWTTIALTVAGFVIFLSASLGLLSQTTQSYLAIASKQAIGLALGAVAFYAFSRLHYTSLRKIATPILLGAIGINLLLFIPALAVHFNGASRWISLGLFSFQPSEFLKIAAIIYFAAWLHFAKERIATMKFGLIPYLVIMGILGVLLLIQSDTDTLVIIAFTGMVMFLVAGMPIRHFLISCVLLLCLIASVIYFRPYAMARFQTYLHPTEGAQAGGYQINQSLIAIGSGGFSGRGFGQSVQKFGYLPQPTDDSIFAVAAEEFGLLGGIVLLALYCGFAYSSFRIGTRSTDLFGGLVAVGLAVLVVTESFLNMAAMLGIVPLSGLPLLFVSHGGTALVITLASAGIVANISRYSKAA